MAAYFGLASRSLEPQEAVSRIDTFYDEGLVGLDTRSVYSPKHNTPLIRFLGTSASAEEAKLFEAKSDLVCHSK